MADPMRDQVAAHEQALAALERRVKALEKAAAPEPAAKSDGKKS